MMDFPLQKATGFVDPVTGSMQNVRILVQITQNVQYLHVIQNVFILHTELNVQYLQDG
jgi:hypothetical protein